MKIAKIGNDIGNGVLAGLAGTAAMTLSSTLEAKLRGRPFSTARRVNSPGSAKRTPAWAINALISASIVARPPWH